MTPTSASPDEPRPAHHVGEGIGLAPRLFLTNALVIVTGAGTLLLVALLFAPPLFHAHLQQAHLPEVSPQVRDHVDAAFERALSISLVVGVGVAMLAAGAISWLVARRLAAPVHDVAMAAQRLADGQYQTLVEDARLGPEFATLTSSVNQLSRRLAATEADRRRLTADLAHQLRTPLASVQATVEAMTDGILAADPSTLAVLADQTARLSRLVEDLEKVSRAEERQLVLHPRLQPLATVVERCIAAVQGRYRAHGVAVTAEEATSLPPVRIDDDRIAEALTNLLDNALRHTPTGGRVTVTLKSEESQRPTQVRVTVADTGEGFVPDQDALLFERFHRGSQAAPGSGSGLGLTIARAIAEAHGGSLTAHSDGPGRGASFTLTLPAAR
ncbi:MAG: HAMP domain-containing sensor histidine kinase [Kineosporiaceae bacterium]